MVGPGAPWRTAALVASTGSTQTDLVAAARAGEPAGMVRIAEEQTAGYGRLGRRWVSPPGAGLWLSVVVAAPRRRVGWVPLAAGLAVHDAVASLPGQARAGVGLKWPNDLMLGPSKVAGLVAELLVEQGVAVVGVGVNVTTAAVDLPPGAVSLAGAGLAVDRAALARDLLGALAARLGAVRDPDAPAAAAVAADYRERCVTLGRAVTVHLPGGAELVGRAEAVDDEGCLVVRPEGGAPVAVAAGDVVHLR